MNKFFANLFERKKAILGILLLALFMVSFSVGGVRSGSGTYVIYDDTETFWTGAEGSTTTYGEDTTHQYYGQSCYAIVSPNNDGKVSHDGSTLDFSSYTKINIYLKSSVASDSIVLYIGAPGWADKYYKSFTITNEWVLYSWEKSTWSSTGSPNWATVEYYYIFNMNVGTLYMDRFWMSGSDNQTLQVLDPTYATLVPVVGNHSYIDGQPVKVTATMLANYTFLKYSFYPVSDSTSNPAWIVMDGNYTLTTVLAPPVAVDYGVASLALVVLFIMLGLTLLFAMKNEKIYLLVMVSFATIIDLLSLAYVGLPFSPYLQIVLLVVEWIVFMFAVW